MAEECFPPGTKYKVVPFKDRTLGIEVSMPGNRPYTVDSFDTEGEAIVLRAAGLGEIVFPASACSAVRVISAFKAGFRRSIRAKKCRVSSTLEILRVTSALDNCLREALCMGSCGIQSKLA